MSPSIQALVDEFKNVAVAKIYFEYQDNSTPIELLPYLVNVDSQSEVKDNLMIFKIESFASTKKLPIETLEGKWSR